MKALLFFTLLFLLKAIFRPARPKAKGNLGRREAKKTFGEPAIKGFIGEQVVHIGALLWLGNEYRVYGDIYLPRPDGHGTTQVDHVVVSVYGIFVIETKNYQGWIFGSENNRRWTQCLKGGIKNPFQNPLWQNNLHVNALGNALGLPKSCFHSIVYFSGECTFKTSLPDNVLQSDLRSYILEHQSLLLTPAQVDDACRQLNSFENDKAELKALHQPRS